MNAEQILLKTLLGDAEYRSVIYDVEPDMLPRGISTPGNMRFSVRDMTMFEEVYDAYVEELNAAIDRALTHLDENGGHTLTLERIPETAHTLASIAYAVFRYMALYDIYKSLDPENCVLFLVLSILFGVTEPFFLFFSREKDGGMPPRKQPVQDAPSSNDWVDTQEDEL